MVKSTWKPSWVTEKRTPAFINESETGGPLIPFGGKKYFWGNMPSLDVLNLPNNEGRDYGADLHLLFAGKS